MIALAAAMRLQRGLVGAAHEAGAFDVKPRWDLAQIDAGVGA
jgi:hypothetical protein